MRLTTFALIASLALGACASCATPPAMPRDAAPPDTITGESHMAAFTFTADAGTDQLTIAAHGLNTGAGPVATRNVGGALPAATPAIGPLLDRWVIRVDANTIKLAASSSDAFLGTAINITSNGTGTNILEIGVPFRRPRTYADGSILFPEDLNAYSDAFVAIHDLFTGQSESVWSGNVTLAGALSVGGATTITGALAVTGATTLNGGLNGPVNVSVISPAIVTGNNNDFAPTGFSSAIVVLFSGSGSPVITGLAGGTNGRMVYLVNAGGVTTTITHQDTNSSASNRFLSPTAATITLTPNQGTLWMYDTAGGLNRWRLLSKNF